MKHFKNWVRKQIPERVKKFIAYSDEVEYGVLSFSQFGEDMIIRSILPEKNEGVYIDIGAHHPIKYSNTYFLYKKGWSGIVIDPLPGAMENFSASRPRDIALGVGISDEPGELKYYCFQQSLYNTFSENRAQEVERSGHPIQQIIPIKVIRLEEVLDTYLPDGKSIDLLSIDAEGFDLKILRSMNWIKFKPSLIVIENLQSDISNLKNDPICLFLESLGYQLVCFTKVNLYFKL